MLLDIGESAALFEGSQNCPACPSDKSSINVKVSTEQWWNDTDRGQLKYWEIILYVSDTHNGAVWSQRNKLRPHFEDKPVNDVFKNNSSYFIVGNP
jgi:hypothetical protein